MKIYVSSTFEDLKEFRHGVYQQLRKLRIDAVAMEDYVASEKRPLAKCLEDVAESDIYVGIFAWRYGYIPKEGNPESRSITELEYRAAGQHSKERLIFLLRDDAPWKPNLMDMHSGEGDGGRQIERLREELGTRHAVGFFSSPDELAKEVSAAVTNVLLRDLGQVQIGDKRSLVTGVQPFSTGSVIGDLHGFNLTWHAYLRGLHVARNVGRIEDVAGRGMASGFLVSGVTLHPQFGTDLYLLTPAHVIAPEKTQQSFGLTVDQAKFRLTIPDEAQQPIPLADIAWFSPVDELDLSVVRLKQQPRGVSGLAVADKLPVNPSNSLEPSNPLQRWFRVDPRVIIIGHPGGRDLTVSLGGVFLEHDATQLQYFADTEAGSGGSPVLNSFWQVIGVHRLRGDIRRLSGEARVNDACQAVSLPAVRQALRAQFG
jgi:Domain of unknown function (DUF4062)/Trypsin-like peptidase domain